MPIEGNLLERLIRGSISFGFRHANLGVPIFFVISGYCIAAASETAWKRGLGGWRFLARRVWRIYPPYWGSVLWFASIMAGLDALGLERLHSDRGTMALQLLSPGKIEPLQWLGNLTLTEEWRPLVWRPPYGQVYTLVAWSLCYEEQFYFICFLILLLAPRRLFGCLLTVTAVCLFLRVALSDVGALSRIHGAFPLLWHEFAIGLAVYWRLHHAATTQARRAVELALAGLVVASSFDYLNYGLTEWSTGAAAGFGLLLIVLWRWDDRLIRQRWLAPLRACGLRSYSIYLIHLPVCTVGNQTLAACFDLSSFWSRALFMAPVVTLASVGAGWCYYHGVERHFHNPPLRNGSRKGTATL